MKYGFRRIASVGVISLIAFTPHSSHATTKCEAWMTIAEKTTRDVIQCINSLQIVGNDLNTVLYRAVDKSNVAVVEAAIRLGADVNAANSNSGLTPLYTASFRGNKSIVEFLISAGANVNKNTPNGVPLWGAVYNIIILKTLLQHGANIDARNNLGWTPLYSIVSASRPVDLALVNFFISSGADVNARDQGGNYMLAAALHKNDLPLIKLLLSAGAEPNARDNFGRTPLMHARSAEAVALLVRTGADVNYQIFKSISPQMIGRTALFSAHNPSVINKLAEYGINVFSQDYAGRTAIFYPISAAVIGQFQKMGLDVNSQDKYGLTPVMIWVKDYSSPPDESSASIEWDMQRNEVIKGFITAGADLTIKDNAGFTVFDYAEQNPAFQKLDAYWLLHDKKFQ